MVPEEFKITGVTVTTLESGAVTTGFFEITSLRETKLDFKKRQYRFCCKIGYYAMLEGKLMVINDITLRFVLDWDMPYFPSKIKLKMCRGLQKTKASK